MKLSKEVLLEIVALVQDGIFNDRDISDNLRQLDLEERLISTDREFGNPVELTLSPGYIAAHPRVEIWPETGADEQKN
jgi:hypothetical protein